MSKSSSTERILMLRSSDGHIFSVEEAAALQSKLIRDMMDVAEEEDINNKVNNAPVVIPIPVVNARILSKVIEYCRYHAVAARQALTSLPSSSSSSSRGQQSSSEEEKQWDESFVNGMEDMVSDTMMLDMVSAANYLNVEALLKLMMKAVADQMTKMSVTMVRKAFGIVNDLSVEEEEQIRRDNSWAFYDEL